MRQLRGKPLNDLLKGLARPEVDLVFVLQDVQDPVNVGSAFRIADACKVREVVLTGISARPPHPLIKKVGRGRDRRVPWRYVEQADGAILELREDGYEAVALELASGAQLYTEAQYSHRVCLVVGHEDHGVTNRTLAACDRAVYLPMYGRGASLNVHVSLGVTAYHILHSRVEPDAGPIPSCAGCTRPLD